MKYHYKPRQSKREGMTDIEQHLVLFPDKDAMVVHTGDCFWYARNVSKADGHERIREYLEKRDPENEPDVDDSIAEKVIKLGENYRQEWGSKGIYPLDAETKLSQEERHKLDRNVEETPPRKFQEAAKRLFKVIDVSI